MQMKRAAIYTITLCILFLGLPSSATAQSDAESPNAPRLEFQKQFDDRSGILTDDDIASIQAAADKQEQDIGLKAYLLIMPKIPEWDFDEYARDQFDHWRMKGVLNSKSYLILISVEDKKFQVVRGSYIDKRDNDYNVLLLRNSFYIDLKSGDYSKAIVNYINGFSELPSLKKSISEEKRHDEKASYYILIGILILIMVFLRMGFIRRQQEQRRKEMKEKSGPFIE
ncbi:TPM domain-containing protein [bacterium]|nr:TPM domain-containing protein [bacterium]